MGKCRSHAWCTPRFGNRARAASEFAIAAARRSRWVGRLLNYRGRRWGGASRRLLGVPRNRCAPCKRFVAGPATTGRRRSVSGEKLSARPWLSLFPDDAPASPSVARPAKSPRFSLKMSLKTLSFQTSPASCASVSTLADGDPHDRASRSLPWSLWLHLTQDQLLQ